MLLSQIRVLPPSYLQIHLNTYNARAPGLLQRACVVRLLVGSLPCYGPPIARKRESSCRPDHARPRSTEERCLQARQGAEEGELYLRSSSAHTDRQAWQRILTSRVARCFPLPPGPAGTDTCATCPRPHCTRGELCRHRLTLCAVRASS